MKKYDTFDDYKLDHKVISFLEFNSYVIVLFDYMDFPKTEQAKNLRCYNKNMELKWIAEHPTNAINDCYTQIRINKNSLEANNFAGYFCKIDLETGMLMNSEFTK